ncbi:MAG: GGDEF domain-containing protein [Proteobacteria bacterium]|nr:GGDEF domain-containing protein [Pseudomonadota bacterium]
MRLDIPTLAVVTVFVTALLGGLLAFAGLQNRAVRAPVTWGAAFVLCAIGMALVAVRGMVPDWLSIQFANVTVLVGIGLVWVGARQFDGRRPRATMVAAAPLIWLAACAIPEIRADINLRTVTVTILSGILAFAAAHEVWRGRSEPLMSRWPAAITLSAYGAIMVARAPVTLMVPQPAGAYQFTASALYPFLSFATLLFSVVVAFLLLNMTKERTELRHKTAALVDPLTGVANRRAFLTDAQNLATQRRADGTVLAILLFDLDHFKAINDRLGHAAGDAVLMNFAATATRILGPDVLFGRIGGEEFGALLRVREPGEALTVAETLRRDFAAAEQADDVAPTVSIGLAIENEKTAALDGLMAAADRALYRAKSKGRNRVVTAGTATDEAESGWRKVAVSA